MAALQPCGRWNLSIRRDHNIFLYKLRLGHLKKYHLYLFKPETLSSNYALQSINSVVVGDIVKNYRKTLLHFLCISNIENRWDCFNPCFNVFMMSSHLNCIPAEIYLFKGNNGNKRTMCSLFKVNNKDTRATSLTLFWCLHC